MPDSKEILFSARGSLWRLATAEQGAPARLPFVGEDGLMPVVSRPQSGRPPRLIYVRSSTDRNIWRLQTPAPGVPRPSLPVVSISSTRDDEGAQFSPDGQRVVFGSNRSGENEIWLADPDGANAVQLTSMSAEGTSTPRWSPDGRTIAFNSNLEGQQEIYVVPAGGGKPSRLTSHEANDIQPSFSRDGGWIYFASGRSGEFRIWKVPVSGGDAVQVTRNVGVAALEAPDDAVRLLYADLRTGGEPVMRVSRSPGGEPVKVLDGVVMRAFMVSRMRISPTSTA